MGRNCASSLWGGRADNLERLVVNERWYPLADIVEDGVTGILVPPGETTPLAEALRALLFDPELSMRFAAAARARMKERFAFDRMVTRYAELFWSLSRGDAA